MSRPLAPSALNALPVLTELSALLRRLALEEKDLLQKLAALEDQVRRFEDQERPAYEAWLRLEFGPRIAQLEEVYEQLRVRRILVQRIEELIDTQGLAPREALYVATGQARPAEGEKSSSDGTREKREAWDAEEIEARKRAKKEAKREARRAEKKQKGAERAPPPSPNPAHGEPVAESRTSGARRKLVTLYRSLARKLHPDSAVATPNDARAQRLWLEVQAAYEAQDFERLLSVAAWLGDASSNSDSPMAAAELTLAERFERLRSLGISRYRLQKNMARLTEHPAWAFTQPNASNGKRKLRQRAARQLEQELERAQEALSAYEDFIESIGPARPPRDRKSGRR